MKKLIKKLKKGFTLVELVVVIAIIAILAGVVTGTYFGITDSANKSAALQAAEQYKTILLAEVADDKIEVPNPGGTTTYAVTYTKDTGITFPTNTLIDGVVNILNHIAEDNDLAVTIVAENLTYVADTSILTEIRIPGTKYNGVIDCKTFTVTTAKIAA